MRIQCFESTPEESAYLKQALPGVEILFNEKKAHEDTTTDEAADVLSVFVASAVKEDVLKRFPNLKFIATRSTGYDHVDLAAAAARGIVVSNVPSYGEHTVAEFAFGMLLALSRKIYLGIDRLKETGQFSYDGLQGFDLRGRTIGIVGTGRIGKHVVAMANGFAMKIVAYDPYPDAALAKQYGFEYLSLDALLEQSDVVTLHVPYLASTHHILNAEKIAKLKPNAVLVNVSRGALVDTEALLTALKEKKIAGAALDVLEEEGIIKDEYAFLRYGHPNAEQLKTVLESLELVRLPNVLVSPHMAFNTTEGVERILKTTVDNIKAYQAGAPINTVKSLKA